MVTLIIWHTVTLQQIFYKALWKKLYGQAPQFRCNPVYMTWWIRRTIPNRMLYINYVILQEHEKGSITQTTKDEGRDAFISLGFHMLKIGKFPSIVNLPSDQDRLKSSPERERTATCLFCWLRSISCDIVG